MLTFQCSEHGEQELKDAVMLPEKRGLILELACSCTFKLVRNAKDEITQKRLTFRQSRANAKAKREAGNQ